MSQRAPGPSQKAARPCSSRVRVGEERAGVGADPIWKGGAAEEGAAVQSEVKGGRFDFFFFKKKIRCRGVKIGGT